jgi:hypothetical protein
MYSLGLHVRDLVEVGGIKCHWWSCIQQGYREMRRQQYGVAYDK